MPGFLALQVYVAATVLGRGVSQITLSWLAFELTGSPFLVGLMLAVRFLPQFLFGLPLGVLTDQYERRPLLIGLVSLTGSVSLVAASLAGVGWLGFPGLVVVTFAYGLLDTARTTAVQTFAYELMPEGRAARGIALTGVFGALATAVGGLLGGLALDRFGVVASFLLIAVASGGAALALGVLPRAAPRVVERETTAPPGLGYAVELLRRNPLIRALALVVIVTEILGFANQTLLPTFARDIFAVGPTGLGALSFARSAGGVVSLLVLARVAGPRLTTGVFLWLTAGLGLSLILFAGTPAPAFALALVLMGLIGASMSALDSLGATLVQQSAQPRERGAAMGIWVFCVGFGPPGLLGIGAVADLLGAPFAQSISGALLIAATAVMALQAPFRRPRAVD